MDKRQSTLAELRKIAALGEGQGVEFKEGTAKLDREIVAFANAAGGTIFCGVSDSGEIVGVDASNRAVSQIHDSARNCDPPIVLRVSIIDRQVIKIEVPEGSEKPYQCSAGVFLRIGANSQKLKIKEVKELLTRAPTFFDNQLYLEQLLKRILFRKAFNRYCQLTGIAKPSRIEHLLESLQAAGRLPADNRKAVGYYLTNAGVLLFTEAPQKIIRESYLTAVRYGGSDKFTIVDRQEITGDLILQIENALGFVKRQIGLSYEITGAAKRVERYEYPLEAIREALINAVVHRDYSFQNSCVYVNIFADRLEIENPGGIFRGIPLEEIEGRSVRRNPIVADLLYRAGYGEKLGSGIARIKQALRENNNPPPQIVSTNFFAVRFYPRVATVSVETLNERELAILQLLKNSQSELASTQLAAHLNMSTTTVTRAMKNLLSRSLVIRTGIGKSVKYRAPS